MLPAWAWAGRTWRIGICGRGYMNSTVPERAGVSLLFVEHMFVQ